ncbi:MAG TPA: hypothetical protein VJ225_02460 [Nitrososphaeraceae archaeon]|nr:hypothetical protein [Nitrososphaeraceae archaeon]
MLIAKGELNPFTSKGLIPRMPSSYDLRKISWIDIITLSQTKEDGWSKIVIEPYIRRLK